MKDLEVGDVYLDEKQNNSLFHITKVYTNMVQVLRGFSSDGYSIYWISNPKGFESMRYLGKSKVRIENMFEVGYERDVK